MKVRVDSSRCQGHTLCAMVAPETFDLDDVDGHASTRSHEVPVAYQAAVDEAARCVPNRPF